MSALERATEVEKAQAWDLMLELMDSYPREAAALLAQDWLTEKVKQREHQELMAASNLADQILEAFDDELVGYPYVVPLPSRDNPLVLNVPIPDIPVIPVTEDEAWSQIPA